MIMIEEVRQWGGVSRTQVLLIKIIKLCSEIHNIKQSNKLNNIAVNLSKINSKDEHTSTPPPQQDTGGMDDLRGIGYEDSSPNYQSHLSYKTCTPQDNVLPLDHTLSLLTPAPLRSSHTSPPPSELSSATPTSPSSLDPEAYRSATSNGNTSSDPLLATAEAGVMGSREGREGDDPDSGNVIGSELGLQRNVEVG